MRSCGSAGVAGRRSLNLPAAAIDIDPMDKSLLAHRQLLNSVLAVTAVSTQFLTLLISPMAQDKAKWNDAETTALVDYLWERRAECGEGGSFKDPAYNAAADKIAPEWSAGPVKTGKHCRTKWGAVSIYPLLSDQ